MTTANHSHSHHRHCEGKEEANEANGHYSHHHHHHHQQHDDLLEKKEETSHSHSLREIHTGCAGGHHHHHDGHGKDEANAHSHSHSHSHGDHTGCSGGYHHQHDHGHVEDDDVTARNELRTSELSSSMTGRSQFHVPEICCSSEIPGINSIVQSLEGVASVKVAVATKTVYVNHDVTKVSSGDISQGRKD